MITRSNALLILLIAVVAQPAFSWIAPSTHNCPGAPPSPDSITIFYNTTTIFAAPPIRHVLPGEALKFTFAGPPGVDYEVIGDSPSDTWLNGSGNTRTDRHFFVCVPTTVEWRDEFKYSVEMSKSPLLDPIVLDPIVRILN
jgi:hypothetical protein